MVRGEIARVLNKGHITASAFVLNVYPAAYTSVLDLEARLTAGARCWYPALERYSRGGRWTVTVVTFNATQ